MVPQYDKGVSGKRPQWRGLRTLPDYLYQKGVPVGEKVDLNEPHEGPEQEVRDLLESAVNVINDTDVMKTN